ncbi:MAG: HAD family hydrolase [Clostridia bacterium]|nr:HAD family hydrolase [Clostridia bacterium]
MIRLIACDMDGTLLDSRKRLPQDILPVLRALKERGVLFAVASGRQYAALRRDLEEIADDILFICENGALVMHHDKRLLIDPVDPADLPRIIGAVQGMERVYPVICCAEKAYVQRGASDYFLRETLPYYPSCEMVDDLRAKCAEGDVCKVAFFDEGDAQTGEYPALQETLGGRLAVILSGSHWVDVMKPGVHKGKAMEGLQQMLGIAPEECMAFGDYLNDCELLAAVGESYAMANAHPDLKAMAKYIAPSNDEDGVLRVLRERFSL